jgi:hypothetical protein
VAVALVALVGPRAAEACAGCRNPSLAGVRGSEGPLAEGALRAGAILTGTAIHVVHEAGCADPTNCSETPAQPIFFHDQRLYPLELRLTGEYGLDETFGVELQLPLRTITTTIEYKTPEGAPYEPLDPGVHHRNETLVGIGDPWLLLRAGGMAGDWWLAARPGVSLPLGRTEEDPFALGDQGLRHQHIQFGSGTFDPVGVLEASNTAGAIDLDFFAQGQASLYENQHGYRAPWRVYGGASIGTELAGDLSGSLGLEAFHEAAERWQGVAKQDGNLGRTEALAAVSFTLSLGATLLGLDLRAPLWRNIVTGAEDQGTLSSPLTVSLRVEHLFGAPAAVR